MIKKTMLLAMAVAAFAIPASASASGLFYHEGSPIEGELEEGLTGWFAYHSNVGGVKCDVHPQMTLSAGGGTLATLGITTETCVGSGWFFNCTLGSDQLHEPLPTLTPTATDIDLQGVVLTSTYGGSCTFPRSTLTFPSLTLDVDNPDAISLIGITGTGALDPAGFPFSATGELEVENPEAISLT